MDIEKSIQQMLDKSYSLEKIEILHNGHAFTIRNSQQLQYIIKFIESPKENIYRVRFENLKDFNDFSNAFNINILKNIYEDLKLVKNEFNFLNSYFYGHALNFENIEEFINNCLLRSDTDKEYFFAFLMKIELDYSVFKFSMNYSYSYFDLYGSGVFEDNLHDFRLSFLKKYVVPLLDKPLDELSLCDYKILQMINI
jgi:hypothetical protein